MDKQSKAYNRSCISFIAVVPHHDEDLFTIAVVRRHPGGRHEIGIIDRDDFPAQSKKSDFPQFLQWAKENDLMPAGDANRPGLYVFYPPWATELQTHLAFQALLLWAGVDLPNVIE